MIDIAANLSNINHLSKIFCTSILNLQCKQLVDYCGYYSKSGVSELTMIMQKRFSEMSYKGALFLSRKLRDMPPYVALMLLAVITGLLTGACAFLLKMSVRWVSTLFTSHFQSDGANWALLVLPIAGIMFTGIYQRYILHKEIYHGTERLNNAIAHRRYRLAGDLTYAPMIASTLTLGFGGSAGAEGPIAYTGAAIGSNIGKAFRVSPGMMKVMLACGASAGIAGIFKAPVGGVLFSLEVLSIGLSAHACVALFLSSLSASLTSFVLSGCTTDLVFHNVVPLSMDWMPWVILLGIFCGLYSFYYSAVMSHLKRWYYSMKNPWMMNLVSGSILAVLVFIFPPLFGEGYGFMSDVLAGDMKAFSAYSLFAGDASGLYTPILIASGIIAVKAFACVSSNSGGGVAGDFAPTLMAGCVAGFFFVSLLNLSFGKVLPVGNFSFFGMAAVMAGAVRAPFMAIFITVEMAQAYSMILPVAVAAAVSYLCVLLLRRLFRMNLALPKSY